MGLGPWGVGGAQRGEERPLQIAVLRDAQCGQNRAAAGGRQGRGPWSCVPTLSESYTASSAMDKATMSSACGALQAPPAVIESGPGLS